FRADTLEPVIGDDIRTPRYQRLRLEEILDQLGAAQARNAKERRDATRIAERRVDRRNAAVDFLRNLLRRQALERKRMVLAMRADGMAGIIDAADQRRMGMRHL